MKYNTEKVLYFANGDKGLHVSVNEPDGSTLTGIVGQLLGHSEIEEVGKDDSGTYYKTTKDGQRALLKLQIQWRKNNGRDFADLQQKLDAMAF